MERKQRDKGLERADQEINDMRRDLPEFKQPRFDLHKQRRLTDPDLDQEDPDMKLSNNKVSISPIQRRPTHSSRKTAMFPFTTDSYGFRKGDWVKQILDSHFDSTYIGVVERLLPKANKVEVRWPFGIKQEDPEMLLLINKDESEIAARTATKISNLVRVAREMKRRGHEEMATFSRMQKQFGTEVPMHWVAGCVELTYPKKTASYSENGLFVREMVHLARDMSLIYAHLDDEYKDYVGIL